MKTSRSQHNTSHNKKDRERNHHNDSFEEQKQPLTASMASPTPSKPHSSSLNSTSGVAPYVPPMGVSSGGCSDVLPPAMPHPQPPQPPSMPPAISYTSNPCPVASCAGCVQQLQQQHVQQQQEQQQMEMTAILHSQPQLQLVSCHGPIMHPSTPSNQR